MIVGMGHFRDAHIPSLRLLVVVAKNSHHIKSESLGSKETDLELIWGGKKDIVATNSKVETVMNRPKMSLRLNERWPKTVTCTCQSIRFNQSMGFGMFEFPLCRELQHSSSATPSQCLSV